MVTEILSPIPKSDILEIEEIRGIYMDSKLSIEVMWSHESPQNMNLFPNFVKSRSRNLWLTWFS